MGWSVTYIGTERELADARAVVDVLRSLLDRSKRWLRSFQNDL
jgi:hypothetical protein